MTGYPFKIVLNDGLDTNTDNPIAIGCGMTEEHRDNMIRDTYKLAKALFSDPSAMKCGIIEDYDGGFGVWWMK